MKILHRLYEKRETTSVSSYKCLILCVNFIRDIVYWLIILKKHFLRNYTTQFETQEFLYNEYQRTGIRTAQYLLPDIINKIPLQLHFCMYVMLVTPKNRKK